MSKQGQRVQQQQQTAMALGSTLDAAAMLEALQRMLSRQGHPALTALGEQLGSVREHVNSASRTLDQLLGSGGTAATA